MPKLTLPNVEKIIDEAIGNILMRYKKNNLKDLLMLENFSNIINEIEEEAEKIYRNYERNAVEQYLRNKSLISKDIFTAIHTIIDNSLIPSLANTRRARAGSSSQIILVKLLREKGIKCDVAKFKYKVINLILLFPPMKCLEKILTKFIF
jgi:hypothetical protein